MVDVKVTAQVRLPRPPNYLRYGDDQHQLIDVAHLSKEEVELIAKALAEQFIEHARRERSRRAGGRPR